MIYTSYYNNSSSINTPVISIAGKCPNWYLGLEFKLLAPQYWFFKLYKEGKYTIADYTKAFNEEVLGPLVAVEIVNKLTNLVKTTEFTLLCYEKPEEFCHRHLVAEWLNKNGYECKEFNSQNT